MEKASQAVEATKPVKKMSLEIKRLEKVETTMLRQFG
ncbi:hypothetical protein Nocox_09320 [Nonomuraea coxensis DSM 45129]|uniref:Uncharacterized protein n=1 Tax=Nonomuraea coxensis DSM 45129 TaxID=1122611 RepID=A0ABX8TVW4_9ACTN|nr:hypothetical protein Nocox_09320 [Nonomuraea coxensis DSM 45129]